MGLALSAWLGSCLALAPGVAHAQETHGPRVLVINGDAEWENFAASAFHGYQAAKAKGWPAELRMAPGSRWLLDGRLPPTLKDKRSVGTEIAAFIKDAPADQALLLFLIGHGRGATFDDVQPPSADALDQEFAIAKGDNLTTREIARSLPTDRPVILLGTYCMDGALHQIAFDRTNTIAVTGTGYRTSLTFSITRQTDGVKMHFANGFWDEIARGRSNKQFDIDGDHRTSPFEGWLAGLAADPYNEVRGQISSMAYVDQQLGLDQYGGRRSPEFTRSQDVLAATKAHPALARRVAQSALTIPTVCDVTANGEGCQKLVEFQRQVMGYLRQTEDPTTIQNSGLPAPLRTLWQRTLTDWKTNGPSHIAHAEAIGTRRDALFVTQGELDRVKRNLEVRADDLDNQREAVNTWWRALSPDDRKKEENIQEWNRRGAAYRTGERAFNADVGDWRTKQRALRERFDALQAEADRHLQTVRYQYRLIRKLERAALFLQTETDKAKRDKLLALLAQEMRPLE